MNCISHTGRMPMCAAPAAAPTKPASLMRRVDHPLGAEAVQQPLGHLERAAVGSDVLAQAEDARVSLHLLEQSLADRLEVGGLSHRGFPSSPAARGGPPRSECPPGTRAPALRPGRRRLRAAPSSGSGGGEASASSVASIDLRLTRASIASSSAVETPCCVAELADVAVDRIVLAGPAVDLAGWHVRLVVVLRVTLSPIGHQLDQASTPSPARARSTASLVTW